MIASLAKFIDWSVLQIGCAMLPQSTWREAANEQDLKPEQTVQFLNGPDFIPTESQPAQLDFIPDAPDGRFRFPTPRPCAFAENNVVHGRLYRCADAWQGRPVISKENVLLIEGMYDLMGWGAPIELWQSWGQPDNWRLPQGHISTALTALMPGLPGRILRWLAPRLTESTSDFK